MNKPQKPFLKWVGGKTQLFDKILPKIQTDIRNYHEPFLGGGSILLAVLSLQRYNKIKVHEKIYAYDLNENLINLYKHVQNNVEELYDSIQKYTNEFNSITGTAINRSPSCEEEAKTSKESYYYWIREKYNKSIINSIERSSLFLILNKTCFRGLYREGPRGFNVPFGHYKNPSIITKQELYDVSSLIRDVIFQAVDFTESFKNICVGDFVYIDPPYAPETASSFVKYTESGFDLNKHKSLFHEIKKLNENKVKFVMSNAKVDIVTKEFADFKCEEVKARRAINAKNPESFTKEVLIYN